MRKMSSGSKLPEKRDFARKFRMNIIANITEKTVTEMDVGTTCALLKCQHEWVYNFRSKRIELSFRIGHRKYCYCQTIAKVS